MKLENFPSQSQAGQEKWVAEQLAYKKNGFFVDIGAHNGHFLSNSFGLEKHLQWDGICIEADPFLFFELNSCRSSINICKAVRNYKGFCDFDNKGISGHGHVIQAENSGDYECDTLHNILIECNAPKHIDYISLDIEGLEIEVLNSFPFEQWDVKLWTIEHNSYQDGPENKDKIYEIMQRNGYQRVVDGALVAVGSKMVPFEDWYRKI